jgi:hypothetical protein
MPVGGEASHVARIVIGRRGQLAMRCELVLRFDYGSIVPWVTRLEDGTLEAIAGPDMAVLRTPVALRGEHLKTVGDFTISEGQTLPFVLTYGYSHRAAPEPIDPITAASPMRADFSKDLPACATMSGFWPRNTTRERNASPEIFRRLSRTSHLSIQLTILFLPVNHRMSVRRTFQACECALERLNPEGVKAGNIMPFKVEVGPPRIAIHHGQTALVTEFDVRSDHPFRRK